MVCVHCCFLLWVVGDDLAYGFWFLVYGLVLVMVPVLFSGDGL